MFLKSSSLTSSNAITKISFAIRTKIRMIKGHFESENKEKWRKVGRTNGNDLDLIYIFSEITITNLRQKMKGGKY